MINSFISSNEVKGFYTSWDSLKRRALGELSENLYSIERRNIQQSRLFMIDILPYIYKLYYNWPTDQILRVLDVGIECGGGTALLAELHNSRSNNYLKMEVTGLDINSNFKNYLKLVSPLVKFVKQDIFEIEEGQVWDLVICSHVIEHLHDPIPFIEKLKKLANNFLIIACPYNETDLRPGHVQTIDHDFIRKLSPTEYHTYTNFCWRSRGDCLIMIFDVSN